MEPGNGAGTHLSENLPHRITAANKVAFKMKFFKDFEEEYRRRHDILWPEPESMLKVQLKQAMEQIGCNNVNDFDQFLIQ